MKVCKIILAHNGKAVLAHVPVAHGLWQRFRGLMWRRTLSESEGLLIPHCRSVHTCFMRFPIDLVYLKGESEVVRIVEAVKPYRVSSCGAADSVLEASAGWARKAEVSVGHVLRFESLDEDE